MPQLTVQYEDFEGKTFVQITGLTTGDRLKSAHRDGKEAETYVKALNIGLTLARQSIPQIG